MNRKELLETEISKFLKGNRIDKRKITIRTPPIEKLPTEIFCSICGNRIASATWDWDQLKWVWKQYPHKCS